MHSIMCNNYVNVWIDTIVARMTHANVKYMSYKITFKLTIILKLMD